MKLLVSVNKKELADYLKYTNSFLIGLKNYAINYYEATLNDIKEILNNYPGIELFVSLNKNIFNEDLKDLKEKLQELATLKIAGILFYDLSILSFVKKLNLNIPLVIHQTHMVTNYNICNYYFERGVKYAYLSAEITESEMALISKKSNILLMATFVGHLIISHSKRKLVSNYFEYIKKEKSKDLNTIEEKNSKQKYYIKETNLGTDILTKDILNGTRAFCLLKEKIEYAILDNNLIDDTIFLEVLKLYKKYLNKKIEEAFFIEKVQELIGSYEGFFFQKTIYKVK